MLKKTGYYKGKSNRPGGGGRFLQTVDAIRKKNPSMPVQEAKAIAAKEGRKVYGAKLMAQYAAAGRRRQARKMK